MSAEVRTTGGQQSLVRSLGGMLSGNARRRGSMGDLAILHQPRSESRQNLRFALSQASESKPGTPNLLINRSQRSGPSSTRQNPIECRRDTMVIAE